MVNNFPLVVCALSSVLSAVPGMAQTYPDKPLKLVVPYTPGGSADIIGRTLAAQLTAQMPYPVLVENRAGAAAQVGTEYVARSRPDGYTFLQGNVGSITIAPSLFELRYDPIKDLAPVSMLGAVTSVVAVISPLPVRNIAELVAYSKANPGKLFFTSTGVGSSTHLTGELLKQRAGIDMTHISYKGSAQAEADLLAGRTQVYFGILPSVVPHIKAGKMRPLATTATMRAAALPDVPTVIEAGFNDFETVSWQAVFGPAGTPASIVARVNAEIRKALQAPKVVESYTQLGVDILANTPEHLGDYVRKELASWAAVIKKAGIKGQAVE